MKIEDRKAALLQELKSARDIADAADQAGRDLSPDERSQVQQHLGKANEHRTAITAQESDSDLRKQIAEFGDGIGLGAKGDGPSGPQRTEGGLLVPDRKHTLGQLFVESQAYKDLLSQAPHGVFQEKQKIQSAPVGFKTLITGSDPDVSAGNLVEPDRLGLLVGPEAFQRRLTLRNLVQGATTGTDAVDYVRMTGFVNNAAPVPEATTTAPVGSGTTPVTVAQAGVKPESGFGMVRVQTPVKTIATWMPATKRALADAGQIRAIIDGFIEYFLEEELEDQIVRGDGLGENFEGLASISGTQTQPIVTNPAGAPPGLNLLLGLRRAQTRVRTIGKSLPNGYAIHPEDMQRIDELVDNDGRFYGDGPLGGAVRTDGSGNRVIWGLPGIQVEGAVRGAPWCGDWKKSILWDRQQSSITATDSHMDFFVRNLVAILGESRHAFGVVQPSAFCKVLLPDE